MSWTYFAWGAILPGTQPLVVDDSVFRTSGQPLQAGTLYVDLLADGLQELSSRIDQERLWLGKDPTQMSSFVEAVEAVFDDSGLSDLLSRDDYERTLGEELAHAIQRLRGAFREVNEDASPQDLVASAAMQEVRDLAKETVALVAELRLHGN